MSICTKNLRYSPNDYWLQEIVDEACYVLAIQPLDILLADSENACAVTEMNGDRYITYDPRFFNALYRINPNYVLIIMFHEIGHHYEGIINHQSRNSKERELYADRLAGWLCYKVGITQQHGFNMFNLKMFRNGGRTHPHGNQRKVAFKMGWNDAYNCKPAHRTMRIINKRKKTNNTELLFGLGLTVLAIAAAARRA